MVELLLAVAIAVQDGEIVALLQLHVKGHLNTVHNVLFELGHIISSLERRDEYRLAGRTWYLASTGVETASAIDDLPVLTEAQLHRTEEVGVVDVLNNCCGYLTVEKGVAATGADGLVELVDGVAGYEVGFDAFCSQQRDEIMTAIEGHGLFEVGVDIGAGP